MAGRLKVFHVFRNVQQQCPRIFIIWKIHKMTVQWKCGCVQTWHCGTDPSRCRVCVHHVCICTHCTASCARVRDNANFGLLLSLVLHVHISAFGSVDVLVFLSEVCKGWELTRMSRTAWSVIKYLCPAAWSGQTHLDPEFCCQLLSPSPTLPPVRKSRHSLTLEISIFGSLIPRDKLCFLPHSISIAW